MADGVAQERTRVLDIITHMALAGGASRITYLLADGLDRSRYQPHLAFGPTPPDIERLDPPPDVPAFELPELKRTISPRSDLRALSRLRALIRDIRPSIVLTHSSKAGVLGRFAACLEGVPVILHHVHGWSFHNNMSGVMRRMVIALERHLARRTDGLLFVSTTDIEKARERGIGEDSQYYVVRSGIELDEFTPTTPQARRIARERLGIDDDRFVVGTVARIDDQKAPLDWVAAAQRIARELPEATFVWVGDGPRSDETAVAFEQAGMMDRVVMAGFRDDCADLYAAFDVYMLVSLWEGLPRALVEAMATGTPVVASSVDGNAEIVDHGCNGLLVPPRAPERAAEAVLSLAADDDLRAQMSSRCVETAGEFSVQKSLADLQALYETLLAKKNGEDGRAN